MSRDIFRITSGSQQPLELVVHFFIILYNIMFLKLALLFILLPIIEMVILIELGRIIGTINTILIVIITGIIGAIFAKQEGLSIIYKIKKELTFGKMPTEQLFDGVFILIGGILLIAPGLITDFIGLALLIPITRNIIKGVVISWFKKKIANGTLHMYYTYNR